MIGDRKIIQLSAVGSGSWIALCDDGTVWRAFLYYSHEGEANFGLSDGDGKMMPGWMRIHTNIPSAT